MGISVTQTTKMLPMGLDVEIVPRVSILWLLSVNGQGWFIVNWYDDKQAAGDAAPLPQTWQLA